MSRRGCAEQSPGTLSSVAVTVSGNGGYERIDNILPSDLWREKAPQIIQGAVGGLIPSRVLLSLMVLPPRIIARLGRFSGVVIRGESAVCVIIGQTVALLLFSYSLRRKHCGVLHLAIATWLSSDAKWMFFWTASS